MNTINQILQNLQADVSALAQYVSTIGTGVSGSIQTALANINAAVVQIQNDASVNPIVQATIQADIDSLVSLVAALSNLLPANPAQSSQFNPLTPAKINPLTGRTY